MDTVSGTHQWTLTNGPMIICIDIHSVYLSHLLSIDVPPTSFRCNIHHWYYIRDISPNFATILTKIRDSRIANDAILQHLIEINHLQYTALQHQMYFSFPLSNSSNKFQPWDDLERVIDKEKN